MLCTAVAAFVNAVSQNKMLLRLYLYVVQTYSKLLKLHVNFFFSVRRLSGFVQGYEILRYDFRNISYV
jgi:hypothetical protein